MDVLCRIFDTLASPERFWAVSHVCSCWRFAPFLLERPMVLSISTVDALPFAPTPLKLFIAKSSRSKDGTMQNGSKFGYHKASAFLAVQFGSRLIDSAAGIPLFLATDGQIELPSICRSSLAEFTARRYRVPFGIQIEDIYMGTIDDDRIALITDASLLLSRGTAPYTWFTVPLHEFQIKKVIGLVFVNAMVYLLDEDRRLFRAQFLAFSVTMPLLNLTMDLPLRQTWEKLWLIKCPTGASILCIYYREVGNQFQFNAFDLIEEEGTWAWVQKVNLENTAVFVNWGFGSLGFAHKNPERWGLSRNSVYQSHRGI